MNILAARAPLQSGRAPKTASIRQFQSQPPDRQRSGNLNNETLSIKDDELANLDVQQQMLFVMRRVANPVVIVTAPSPAAKGNNGESQDDGCATPFSMTISSFNTVCMNPRPTVSMNIKTPSATLEAIKANGGAFLVHFLHCTPEAAAMSLAFSQGLPTRAVHIPDVTLHPNLFQPMDATVNRSLGDRALSDGSSVLDTGGRIRYPGYTGPSMVAIVKCRMLWDKQMQVGDHVVLCANVEDVLPSAGWNKSGLTLAYGMREYRDVNRVVRPRRSGISSTEVTEDNSASELSS